jgi:hypothetical protein
LINDEIDYCRGERLNYVTRLKCDKLPLHKFRYKSKGQSDKVDHFKYCSVIGTGVSHGGEKEKNKNKKKIKRKKCKSFRHLAGLL